MAKTVVAVLKVKPESTDAVRSILTKAVEEVHREPGCTLYTLHEGDGFFMFVEQWSDESVLNAHNSGAAVTRMVAGLDGHLQEAPAIMLADPLPATDSAKGLLRP